MPRGRKPKIDNTNLENTNLENNSNVANTDTIVPKKKRPQVASVNTTPSAPKSTIQPKTTSRSTTRKKNTAEPAVITDQPPKKKAPVARKKPVVASSPIITNPLIVDQPIQFQEAVIPTILEEEIEQVDTEGYEIEYITLREFELNGVIYYRDSNKEKLYKKNKNGIGPYVGRYYKENQEIDTTILDSDDES
jgi:hypothetical protein